MNPQFLRPAIHRCPACDYDLAGVTSTTCPECGHVISSEDIEFDVRRRTYLELTAPVLWTRAALLIGVAVLWGWGLPLALIALAAAGVLVVAKPGGGLRPRVVRRAWLLAACWLQLPWFLPLVLDRGLGWYLYYWDLHMPLRLADFGRSKVVAVSFASFFGGALWWWSLRRSRRQLGLEELRPQNQRVRWALALAVGVQFAVVGITGSLLGLMELLDALWPGWDR